MSAQLAPVEVFYSYADADASLLDALEQHLSLLQREGLITPWRKRQILPGTDWKEVLDHHLNIASVILLLVSPAFLASDYCYGIEMQQAMLRQESGEACVIPILLRPVDWQSAPFGKLQALPRNRKPITSWSNHDEAFFDVAQGIRAALETVHHRLVSPQIKDANPIPTLESRDIRRRRFDEGLRTLKGRFEGAAGRRLLVDSLKTQKMIAGNSALAEEVASLVEVMAVKAGETIIRQGDSDNDIFFILTGSFRIVVNSKVVAQRSANDHVGEMSAIEPSQARTATVVADEDSVICKLSESQLAGIGQRYGDIWRYFARELVHRLAQRNALITPPRETIRVFIISSTEALHIAREIQSHFEHDNFLVEIWTDGVFRASSYPIESLEKAVDDSDFAIAIAQPDDLTNIRGQAKLAPRDNVIFELGILIGRLGRKRTLLLEPRGEEVKLPTDFSGLITISYRYDDPKTLSSLLGPACNRMRKIINELGPRN